MGEINDNTRSMRINIPVNRTEYRTVLRAAKVMKIKPAEFGREAVKRAARQVLKKAGVSIRLDMDDFIREGPGEEDDTIPTPPAEPPARYDPDQTVPTPRVRIADPEPPGPLEDDFEGEA